MNILPGIVIPDERIASKILLLRGEKVMLDFHLAELYGIETRALKQAVKRNISSEDEIKTLVSQFVIPSKSHLGGAVPFAFTETGVAMLSSILSSAKAVNINIAIMRTFVIMRKMLYNDQAMMHWQSEIEQKIGKQNQQILLIFDYIRNFEKAKQKELLQKNRNKIGFKTQTQKPDLLSHS